jgi:hypothetical protein
MALKLLQPGVQPLGQFDGYDNDYLTLKGGEVVTLIAFPVAVADKAAYDSKDGYVNPSGVQKRPVVTRDLDGRTGSRPLFLADEGVAGYGTLFGSVVGGTVGQSVSGAVLGPHTATGSGKVTLWDKPGLYGVSLDACDTNATTGLQPTHPTLKTGDPLYATVTGLLTPAVGSAFEAVVVGRFIQFETNGSLVQTPNKLVTSIGLQSFSYAVFDFRPPIS